MKTSFVKRAIFKFNGGLGAILCSACRKIIKNGVDFSQEEKKAMRGEYELDQQFCEVCKQTQKNRFMKTIYYTPPEQCFFDELKKCAITIWSSYPDPYKSEKIESIYNLQNVSDNFMYMVAMFDSQNQIELSNLVSDRCKREVSERLFSSGCPPDYNFFKS